MRLAAPQKQQLLRVRSLDGEHFHFEPERRPSRCTYVQSTVMYGESTPTQRCVDGDQRPQHSPKILKRAVERDSQFEPTKLRLCLRTTCRLCAPQTSKSCRPVQNKEFQPISWHQFPPFCLLRNWAITGCENALQRNVVGLFVGGCGCGCVGI